MNDIHWFFDKHLNSFPQFALMEMSDWQVVLNRTAAGGVCKFVTTVDGVESVKSHGMMLMHKLFADKLDSLA